MNETIFFENNTNYELYDGNINDNLLLFYYFCFLFIYLSLFCCYINHKKIKKKLHIFLFQTHHIHFNYIKIDNFE
jgi:hypothetical protein